MQFRVSLIPAANGNRPGTGLDAAIPDYITVHETANTAVGADASMHERFTHGGGGPESVSFHFVVDDHEAVQLLPLDEIGWHAGDGCDEYPDGVGHDDIGCFASVAIETCVNQDGDWDQTLSNLAELIAMIAAGDARIDWGDGRSRHQFSVDRIAQHNAWSGKDCPHRIRATGAWDDLMKRVDAAYAYQTGTTRPPKPKYATPLPVPTWDGTDKKTGNTVWHALSRVIHLKADTTPRAWASSDPDEAKAGERLKAGAAMDALYLVKNQSGQWWYVTKEGFRILRSKCKEQFGVRDES